MRVKLIDTHVSDILFTVLDQVHGTRWYFIGVFGMAGIGKTSAANRVIERLEAGAATRTGTFRGHRVEVPTQTPGSKPKQALAAIAESVGVPMRWRQQREMTVQLITAVIIRQLAALNVQWLFIDEAQRLKPESMDALTYLLNEAETEGHPLTIAMVGMAGLPQLLDSQEQVHSRVAEFIAFKPYSTDQTRAFLGQMSPEFAALPAGSDEAEDVLTAINEVSHGLPRQMVQLLARASRLGDGRRLSVNMIRAAAKVHAMGEDAAWALAGGDRRRRGGGAR